MRMCRSNVVSSLQAPATRSKFVPVRWRAANAPMDDNLPTTIAAGGEGVRRQIVALTRLLAFSRPVTVAVVSRCDT